MSVLWDFYWPALMAALVIGVIAGIIAFGARGSARRLSPGQARMAVLAGGFLVALVVAALWHGPLGAGTRFASAVESDARKTIAAFEMKQIQSRLEVGPLRRTLVLSGSADDFQRAELARILRSLPGVSRVRWADEPQAGALPLLAEMELATLVAFGFGLVLAYLLELRRRARADWRW